MSLFGGEASWSFAKAESESATDTHDTPTPSIEAQRLLSLPLDSQSLDNPEETISDAQPQRSETEDTEEPSTDESDEGPARPNKFTGSPSAWRKYTAADRQIATALEQIAAGDLSAHLYNTHALKRRLRLPDQELNNAHFADWRSKERWLKQWEALNFVSPEGDVQRDLVPWKRWSAWPLQEEDVPGPDETFVRKGGDKEEERWTIGSLMESGVGDDLREEMLGVCLRQAKEKWRGRETVSGNDHSVEDEGEDMQETDIEERPKSISRSRSRSIKRSASRASTAVPREQSDIEMQGNTDQESRPGSSRSRRATSRPKPTLKVTRPDILADDDKARSILRPSIDSLLSRLENLADAIRRTRLNHFAENTSGSEGTSDAESMRTAKPRSRSRAEAKPKAKPNTKVKPKTKTLKKRYPSRASSRASSINYAETPAALDPSIAVDDASDSDNYAPEIQDKSWHKGSPEEQHKPSDTESTEDEDSPDSESLLRQRRRYHRPLSRPRSSGSGSDSEAEYRVGLMDWSEVLGLAAMTGWNEQAVDRAAKRCSALFGESMAFRTLHESVAKPREPVQYVPDTIFEAQNNLLDASLASATAATRSRPYWERGMVVCPHEDCFGHHKEFPIPYRLVEHIKRVHGYDPREEAADEEEEMHGGVPVDGYMKPITTKHGWRGGDRGIRSRSRSRKRQKMSVGGESEEDIV